LQPQQLVELGILAARANTILRLARAVVERRLHLVAGADVESSLHCLRALPGIGEWTAQYIAMRCLGHRDAFLHTDLIVRRAFPGMRPKDLLTAAEAWRPWRAYATLHLWKNS